MKSKTSFFDPTLLKKNIARFAPAWAILLVGMFLVFPLAMMQDLAYIEDAAMRKESALRHLTNAATSGTIFAVFAALLFAGLVFKYLHKTRSAYMMHAFPMTRTCLFVTNAVSGLLFYLVPALVTVLCYFGVLAARGVFGCGAQVWGVFGQWMLQYLFFYGLAVFAMILSGSTIIAVLSYAALNFIFLLIPLMVLILISNYFYGFDFRLTEGFYRLSPVIALMRDPGNLGLLAVCAGIGAALLVLAWVHYRYRQVERAGDAMAYPWARIAFRLVFTLCCALGLGWILAAFFSLVGDGSRIFLPYALLGCFLGWFGSTMMLERTVKVFKNKKVWLGFAAFAGVLVLAVTCLKYDLLGFQKRVPETAKVESVDVWTIEDNGWRLSDRITLTDPAQIDAVRDVHTHALKGMGKESWNESRSFFWDGYASTDLHIEYHLSDGTTLRRCYELADMADIRTVAQLYAAPEVAAAWYDQILPKTIRRAELNGVTDVEIDAEGNEMYLSDVRICTDCRALREALLADAAAGRLPIVNDFWRSTQNEYKSTLYLSLYYGDDESFNLEFPDTAEETIKLFR